MLKHQLIHPQINEILARAGHHGKVLIADGNYPCSSTLGPNAQLVSLNLSPGLVTCTQVLQALVTAIPLEAAQTMDYETTGPYALDEDPPVWAEYRDVLSAAKLDNAYPARTVPDEDPEEDHVSSFTVKVIISVQLG